MITALTLTAAGAGAWELAYASDLVAPVTFYVYRDGVLVRETTEQAVLVAVAPGTHPVFEVLDTAAAPAQGYPATAALAWYAAAGAASYTVQQYAGGAWATVATVADAGEGYFRWDSGVLADGQTHQFKVIPTGANGNDGPAVSFAVLMVRHPDPPAAAYSYNAGTGAVTVAAA